jgi:hypothetical protein
VKDFSQLRYDYQIEMSGYSAEVLRDSLVMRNIQCDCKRCLSPKNFNQDIHKKLTNANTLYGNWPLDDYCRYMKQPINELVINFTDIYGTYHPWITALLLWKFRIQINLSNSAPKEVTKDQVLQTLKQLREAVI